MREQMNVVMLATEKESPLVLNSDGKLEYDKMLSTYGGVTQKHLYITDDSEIREGDWYILPEGIIGFERLNKCTSTDGTDINKFVSNQAKKVIATTNSELWEYSIPKIPQSFIEKYVCEYNTGSPITKVDVEMDVITEYDGDDLTYSNPITKIVKPKIGQDGTITIHPVSRNMADWLRDYIKEKGADAVKAELDIIRQQSVTDSYPCPVDEFAMACASIAEKHLLKMTEDNANLTQVLQAILTAEHPREAFLAQQQTIVEKDYEIKRLRDMIKSVADMLYRETPTGEITDTFPLIRLICKANSILNKQG